MFLFHVITTSKFISYATLIGFRKERTVEKKRSRSIRAGSLHAFQFPTKYERLIYCSAQRFLAYPFPLPLRRGVGAEWLHQLLCFNTT